MVSAEQSWPSRAGDMQGLRLASCSFRVVFLLIVSLCITGITGAAGWIFGNDANSNRKRLMKFHSARRLSRSNSEALLPVGMYVHIPYCRRRCRYCDFAIVPVGYTDEDNDIDDRRKGFANLDRAYRKALLEEIDMIGEAHSTKELSSIYIGGGTPSLAPVETIRQVLRKINSTFPLRNNIEITMEMDPGTFHKGQLKEYKDMGINRISLGVQSLDDDVLKSLGRVHRRQDVYQSRKWIDEVFGTEANLSIDLISGLPDVCLAEWADTLEEVTSELSPTHLSIYDLQIEEGTVFGKWYGDGTPATATTSLPAKPQLPSPDDCAFMYKYASGYLGKLGWEHYEISSYAQDRANRSRHNQIYWHREGEWYACGLGSTSRIDGKKVARPRAMADYLEWVRNGSVVHQPSNEMHDELPEDLSDNTSQDKLTDLIMTRLRTSDGLDLGYVQRKFGVSAVDLILKGAALGKDLGLVRTKGNHMVLSDPDGFLFSNSILSSIFLELEDAT